MDALPEELLDNIFSCLTGSLESTLVRHDSHTLHSLCVTSRKFSRIAKPYLYERVHSVSGTMGHRLLRTLSANPDLAAAVTYFEIGRSLASDCYDGPETQNHPEGEDSSKPDSCIDLLSEILKLLPNVTMSDLSRFTEGTKCMCTSKFQSSPL